MSLAKFRKVFKGHKKPNPPSPKVSPEDTSSISQTPNSTNQFVQIWKIIS